MDTIVSLMYMTGTMLLDFKFHFSTLFGSKALK